MKLKLTESQFSRLQKNLSEGSVDDTYSREVKVVLNHYPNTTYKGMEINDMVAAPIRLSYIIDMDIKSWGVRGISLSNITGPSEIETEINFYLNDDETNDDVITLAIDWSKLKMETYNGEGVITVADEVEINLRNDEQGNLFVSDVEIAVYGL
jgi:hypothetical protein